MPASVEHFLEPGSTVPIVKFPNRVLHFEPEIVVHTMVMGEADAAAATACFSGRVQRLVMLSSGDVYRAYGCFVRLESDCPQHDLLNEDSPLRTVLYPYRKSATSPNALEHGYDKILAERIVRSSPDLPSTILRLPKVYGPEQNGDLATVYRYRHHPNWRWTHGYVENVAAAVTLATEHSAASGRVYNVGEGYTPSIAERLAWMPPSDIQPEQSGAFDFTHDIAYDTSRIRRELGYRELLAEQKAVLQTLRSSGHSGHKAYHPDS